MGLPRSGRVPRVAPFMESEMTGTVWHLLLAAAAFVAMRYLHEQDRLVDKAMERMEKTRTAGELHKFPERRRS